MAAYGSSWDSLTRRLATRGTTDNEIWRGPTERLSPQPVYAAYVDVVGGTLDSWRANAQESGCQIGSPHVASTIVSAHSPPRAIGRVSAQAVSGHLKWVMRALRTIQRLCARFVKLSNHATREFDVSLWPAGGRIFAKKCLRVPNCAPGRRAAAKIGDLA